MTADPAANDVRKGIVWIASYPKSGNTWTRAFLHNLIKIVTGDGDGAQKINEMNEYSTWDISAEIYQEFLDKDPREADRAEIAQVQEKIAEQTDGLSFVKTHNALTMDRGFPTINSAVTSGAIYIVRNPLDVAISYAHHMGRSIDHAIEFMAKPSLETSVTEKSVYEVYGSWSEHVLSWTRKPNRAVHVMRYEDMIADPSATFGKLARHLLMVPTAAQLAEATDRSSFDRLQKQEAEEGFTERPKVSKQFFREGKTGQWKTALTPRQVRRIVTAHEAQMARFGYLPEQA
ncbi:sulfotransferase domain-containing protein [Nordella sp. HKS 07]|uniref:sulfotransferase domain-containing protein n=1 Tax=Nordella sp. HKS 07 TaxID=2712222 RepID=UPI0013E155ED|nr:sulfotransferase domain-containing protein [Nordella sp. HKS 07]QIG50320.1 sulfotransferase domain-containing protein [Nordella sp. HKS 07]